MPYCSTWEEFAKAAERLYISDPMKVRFTLKYRHCDGKLVIKITDNHTDTTSKDKDEWEAQLVEICDTGIGEICLMYLTEHTQDVKKIEKLTSQLMRHMASKEK